jgi:hypothetical protein
VGIAGGFTFSGIQSIIQANTQGIDIKSVLLLRPLLFLKNVLPWPITLLTKILF